MADSEDEKFAAESAVHNEVTGKVLGNLIQAGYIHQVNLNGPAEKKPALSANPTSKYMKSLVRSIEDAQNEAGDKQLVVTGIDAVAAVRRWARTAGRGFYRERTLEIDLSKSSWRDRANIRPDHQLVLLMNAPDHASVREFREMGSRQKEIQAVVATECQLGEPDGVRVLSMPAGNERKHSYCLLPSGLLYNLYPAGIALAVGFTNTVVVAVICADNSLPGWAQIAVSLLAAVVGIPAGYGTGHLARRVAPPPGGRLSVDPDGIEVRRPSGVTRMRWRDIEFVAIMATRAKIDVLLVKTPLKGREPYQIGTRELGIVGVCLLGIAGLHCDLPAIRQDRDALVADIEHFTLTPVLRTRDELIAREGGLRDRI